MIKTMQERADKLTAQRAEKIRENFVANAKERGLDLSVGDTTYQDPLTEAAWLSWKACEERQSDIWFKGSRIMLPSDGEKRLLVLEELGKVFACYITQMLDSWGRGSTRCEHVFRNVEVACLSARSSLTEEEYQEFAWNLVDDSGLCKKR